MQRIGLYREVLNQLAAIDFQQTILKDQTDCQPIDACTFPDDVIGHSIQLSEL